jgi:DNA-binding transcriptional ArsR family regulator
MKKCCCFDKQSHDRLKRVIDFLKIIAEENRIKILCMLLNEGEMCVCTIWTYLEAPQNLTSHHLKVLKDFGLLKARKEGLNIFYSVNHQEIKKYKELLNCLLLNDKKE